MYGGCVQEPMCNTPIVYQYTTYKIIEEFSCCSTNGCSPPVLPLPDTNTQPNGFWCPTCDSSISPDCSTGETLLCTGNETYCYLQSKYGGSFWDLHVPCFVFTESIKGCATESYCQATNYFRIHTLTFMYENISCVNANPISSGTTIGTTIYTSVDAGTTSGTTGHTNVDAGNAHENNECGNAGSSLKCPGYHSIFLGVAGVVLGILKISF
ncbi:hypothetical protein XENTR_v10019647 [Xenopus tropicalis]|nr:hypothetical protein XENTR_v10019647 [Xenopus tropicalis]